METASLCIQQLDKALDLSGQMLLAVQREEWEALEALEVSRQKLLPDLSSLALNAQQVAQVRVIIEDILHLNHLMVEASTARQNDYRQNNRRFAAGQKAVSAYDSV